MRAHTHWVCRLCGQVHTPTPLAPGARALCFRCGSLLSKGSRFGKDAPLVFSITGLVLSVPSAILPIITAEKLGDRRVSYLFTGVESLWQKGMTLTALLITFVGLVLPLVVLASIGLLRAPERFRPGPRLARSVSWVAACLDHWAFPEVQVLAVLVALMKLGSLVEVTIGPGFWCYCAMSLCLLLAQRSYEFELPINAGPPPGNRVPARP